jgi:hypothetical protein
MLLRIASSISANEGATSASMFNMSDTENYSFYEFFA